MYFNVGETVTVRDWEELCELYPIDRDDDMWGPVNTDFCITPDMRRYCGKEFKVSEVGDNYYHLEDGANYYYEDWMLRHPNSALVFDTPTQVRFYDNRDHEQLGDRASYGIAYHDEIVCACCGGVFEVSEVYDIVKLSWIPFHDEIKEEDF